MYRCADEIEKLQKIKVDSDEQLLQMLQQVKGVRPGAARLLIDIEYSRVTDSS